MFETAEIPITPEVLSLIAEIDEFKGAWRALGNLAPERPSVLRRAAPLRVRPPFLGEMPHSESYKS